MENVHLLKTTFKTRNLLALDLIYAKNEKPKFIVYISECSSYGFLKEALRLKTCKLPR